MLAMIREFYLGRIAIGDRIGEAFYAVWMVVVSIGILNSEMTITPGLVMWVIAVCFGVNLVWGIIDGITVMTSNVIERAVRDRLIDDLRDGGGNGEARRRAREHLADTIAAGLSAAEQERLLDAIAAGPPGALDPDRPYWATGDDWAYALGIIAIDVLLVVPLVAPLLLIPDASVAVYVSRLVATALFAGLGWAYARSLNRNPWLAAALLGALGFAVFTLAYEAGW